MQIDQFMGKAAVLDVSDIEGVDISMEKVDSFIQEHEGLEFLILRTGWEEKWGQEGYFKGFPVFTQSAIDYLVRLGLKGIGLDTISLDPVDDYELTSHKKILKNNCIIIENLCNLGEIGDKEFTFCAFPLKFEKGDGSPVRAVAIL
jgi:kynurenine formamidase